MTAKYTLAELPSIAQKLIDEFPHHTVWVFRGDMGTGKTTLIKEVCEALGVIDEMSSPTFSIVNEYLDADANEIYHFDLYRLNDFFELLDIGMEEYLESGKRCLIEWPDLAESLLPNEYVEISINLVNNSTRDLTAKLNGSTF